jgi:putative ABC transport system permease protein
VLFWTIAKVALRSLLANRLRSFLAMLGIIIGVAAVVSILALGAGARSQVVQRISAMGTDLLVVRPGAQGVRGVRSATAQNLTLADAQAIVAEVPEADLVAPVVSGMAQLKYYNQNTNTNVTGTSVTYLPIRGFEVERGRAFTEGEAERMARVAVLGPTTAENLFGVSEAIGETIKVKGINFRVVGVLKAKGDQGWFNPDDQAIVPYTTAMKQLFGLDHLREIDIQAKDEETLNRVQDGATALLRKRHRIREGADDDFSIRNQAEILDTMSSVTQTFTLLLGGIASISLLVGGIGIMNIMLVTVTERTREIGVRKAIGAKDRAILTQFLLEAILLSGIGGVLGVVAGIGGARLLGWKLEMLTIVEPWSVLLALSFSAAVGIFFGFYPARNAARLDPIEALRYE